MKRFSFFIATGLVLGTLLSQSVFADGGCQQMYGGGSTCTSGNIAIEKFVINPQNNAYVHGLGINDAKYTPGTIASFKIVVTNTGNATITYIDVKDIFPQFVSYASGPGNFDNNTKTLTFGLDGLTPGESRTFIVTGQIAGQNQLPASQDITCVINQASAHTSEGQNAQDNVQFCIQKQAPAPVKQMPATGPEELPLLAMLPTGILGFFLQKSSKKLLYKGGEK